jgi:hypothetical protein
MACWIACSKVSRVRALSERRVLLEFGTALFDGIDVRRVRRQVKQVRHPRPGSTRGPGNFVGAEVVDDHDPHPDGQGSGVR